MMIGDDISIDEHFFDLMSESYSGDDLESFGSSHDDSIIQKDSASASDFVDTILRLENYVHGPQKKRFRSSTDSDSGTTSSDQSARERRLERNRESANKCRQKKKNELFELSSKIAELMREISVLTQENAGLRADNSSLTDHNNFLRSMLSMKLEEPEKLPYVNNNKTLTVNEVSGQSLQSGSGGVAMLGVFGAFSVIAKMLSSQNSQELSVKAGRVFLPLNPHSANVYSDGAANPIYCCVVGLLVCLILAITINFNVYGYPKQLKSIYLPY